MFSLLGEHPIFFDKRSIMQIFGNWLYFRIRPGLMNTTVFICTAICALHAQDTDLSLPAFVKKREIEEFEFTAGVRDHAFSLTNGERLACRVSIPEISNTEVVPFILALHWAGDDSVYREFADCLAFPALQDQAAIVIAPSALGGQWLYPQTKAMMVNLVEQIRKRWPVDREKIGIMGYSNGGIAAWEYAKMHPELFTAGLAMAGSYIPGQVKVPMAVLHGEQDELFKVSDVDRVLKMDGDVAANVYYQVLPGFSHFMACAYADAAREAWQMIVKRYW